MGMYDREPNLEETFKEGDRFIVMGMQYTGTINTRHGAAHRTIIEVVSRSHPTKRIKYSVLGVGFMNMAQRAEGGDFPHVAEFITVDLGDGKRVKRLAPVDIMPRDFLNGDDGPPINAEQFAPVANVADTDTDDIPF